MRGTYLFTPLMLYSLAACGQEMNIKSNTNMEASTTTCKKMKVEIWSDVMCPFCYIGKRKFEIALQQFEHKNDIEMVWRSFQLVPELKTQPGKNVHQFLAERKGMGTEQAKEMNNYVTNLARQVGLVYNFDKTIVANSLNAHRFTHFAKKYNKQNEAEEVLFRSYFTDGKNIDDYRTIIQLGEEIGLDTATLKTALENKSFSDDVKADICEAQQLGVRGVPFFVFNRKYAVSGAQDSKTFLETLQKSFAEWRKENPETKLEIIEGNVCTPDKKCD